MNEVSVGTIVCFVGYLVVSHARFGMTKSISETWYRWMEHDFSSAFTIFSATICAGAVLQSVYPYTHTTKLLLTLAGFFMFCVSIASTYKDPKVERLHYSFAILAIGLGFAAIFVEDAGRWCRWVPVPVLLITTAAMRKWWPANITYKVECVAFVEIFGRLLFV